MPFVAALKSKRSKESAKTNKPAEATETEQPVDVSKLGSLAIILPGPIGDASADDAVKAHHAVCQDVIHDREQLSTDWNALYQSAPTMPLAEIWNAARSLAERGHEIEELLAACGYARQKTCQTVLPAARARRDHATAEFERVVAAEVQRLSPLADALPAGRVGGHALDHQLKRRAMDAEVCLVAKATANRWSCAVESLEAGGLKPPRLSSIRFTRPAADDLLEPLVARFDRHFNQALSPCARYVADDCGLGGAALLDEHVGLLESIARECAAIPGCVLHVDRQPLPVVRVIEPLVRGLPRTEQQQLLLRHFETALQSGSNRREGPSAEPRFR